MTARAYALQLAALLLALMLVEAARVTHTAVSLGTPVFAPAEGYLDFDHGYYPAARAIREDPTALYRGTTYDPAQGTLVLSSPASFVNIPVVAWLFVPLAVLPLAQAGTVLLTTNIAIVVACLFLMQVRAAATNAWGWAITLAFASSGPLLNGLNLGQTTPFVLLLFLLGERFLRQGEDRYAGVCLGLACLIKVPPLLLLPYFALRRRWQVVGAAGVVLLGAAVISIAAYGWPLHRTYLDVVIRANSGTALAAYNCQSIDALLARLFTAASLWSWQPRALTGGVHVGHWLSLTGLVGIAAWTLWGRSGVTYSRMLLELGLVMCLSLAALPVSWSHYGAWLLPVFVVVGAALRQLPHAAARKGFLLLTAAAILVNLPMPPPAIIRRFDGDLWFRIVISHQLFGTLLLLALCSWCIRRYSPAAA